MNADFRIDGKVIETERLILRPFRQTDLEDFYEYASIEGVGENAGWKHHGNLGQHRTKIVHVLRSQIFRQIVQRGRRKAVALLGRIVQYDGKDVSKTCAKSRKWSLCGVALSKSYWGKGLMPEAVNAVIDYLFNELGFDFLICGYYEFNERSKRVQLKCGFKPYRSLVMDTQLGTKEQGVLCLLINPDKNIELKFSHQESLIYNK